MNRIHILLLVLLPSFASLAQTDQLITLKGDTLIGNSSISSNNSKTVQMVSIKNGKDKYRFKVYEVKSLTKGENVYYTVKVQGIYQLGLLVKEGYLSIYKIMDSESTSSTAFETTVLLKKDGSELIVPNIGFRKLMGKYLNDCDVVAKGFEDKTYKKADLELIVDEYNNCVAANSIKTSASTVNNVKTGKVEQVNSLIKAVKEDSELPDVETVLDMLEDVKKKISEGSKIPAYLASALRASLKSNATFENQLNIILD